MMENAREVPWSVRVQGYVQLGTLNALTIRALGASINFINAISFKIAPRSLLTVRSLITLNALMVLVQEPMRTVHHRLAA